MLGFTIESEGAIIPACITTVGDLLVEPVTPHPRHAYADARTVSVLLSAMPTKPALTPEEGDPELVGLLVAAGARAVTGFRAFLLAESEIIARLRDNNAFAQSRNHCDVRDKEQFTVALTEVLRLLLQDAMLSPALAKETLRRAWLAPDTLVRQSDGHEHFRPHVLARQFPRGVDVGAIVVALSAPGAWLYEGAERKRIAAELAARRAAAATAATADTKAAIDLSTRRLTTPKAEGLLVCVQAAASVGAPLAFTAPQVGSYHKGQRIVCYARASWPADVPVPTAVTSTPTCIPTPESPWRILADDAPIELSGGDVATGLQRFAPRLVLDAVAAASRASVPTREPLGPDDVVDMRSPAYKKNLAALRMYLKTCAPAFVPGLDSVPIVKLLAVAFGAVRLKMNATIVACEIFRVAGTKCGDTLVELEALALDLQRGDGSRDIFPPIEGGSK